MYMGGRYVHSYLLYSVKVLHHLSGSTFPKSATAALLTLKFNITGKKRHIASNVSKLHISHMTNSLEVRKVPWVLHIIINLFIIFSLTIQLTWTVMHVSFLASEAE